MLPQIFSKFRNSLTIKEQMLHFLTEMGAMSPIFKGGGSNTPSLYICSPVLFAIRTRFCFGDFMSNTKISQSLMIH